MRKRIGKWSSVYGRMGIVLLFASVVSLLVFLADSNRAPQKNENGQSVLERGKPGSGDREVDLEVEVKGEKAPITIKVEEQKHTDGELQKHFNESTRMLEQLVLGKNKSLDEVQFHLNLVERIPGTGILVTWEIDKYNVLNLLGEIQPEEVPEEGVPVTLRATLSYEDQSQIHVFGIRIVPHNMSSQEKMIQDLRKLATTLSSETKDKEYLTLPKVVEGEIVNWKYPKEYRALGLFVLGVVGVGGIFLQEKQKIKEADKKRKEQFTREYPRLISQFALYLGAGMSVRTTWTKMVQEYEMNKVEKGGNAIYEEMRYTLHELQGGVAEVECYEHFGSRCKLPAYRKFGVLLSKNLRKGTRGLNEILKREREEAFEDRKKQARKLGEEAGTKLLGPMFLMLAVVLAIIVVPAFLTIQI